MAKKIGLCEFIDRAKKKYGDKYDYTLSNFRNFSTKIKIICNSCKGKFGLSSSIFYKRPTDHLTKSQGCPKCSLRKSEKLFAECLDIVAPRIKFSKSRPSFLKFSKSNLELDFYSKKLKLAFEINGAQHYEYIPFFHRDYYNFLSLQCRDEFKQRACEENGIRLISVDLREFRSNKKERFLILIQEALEENKCL